MALTPEDLKAIEGIIPAIVEKTLLAQREMRMSEAAARQKAEKEKNPETKLYLVHDHVRVALPDERGRTILTEVFYAFVTSKDHDSVYFGGAKAIVVALGDRKLEKPVPLFLRPHVSLAEVEESIFESFPTV